MVTANENLNLVQNMYKALNKQDLDAHDDYWTKDMIWHGPPGFGDIFGRSPAPDCDPLLPEAFDKRIDCWGSERVKL